MKTPSRNRPIIQTGARDYTAAELNEIARGGPRTSVYSTPRPTRAPRGKRKTRKEIYANPTKPYTY